MPELPEVETACRGIASVIEGVQLTQIKIYQPRLRWPVPPILQKLRHQSVKAVQRRAKYILLQLETGTILLHLGMSGSLRILTEKQALKKHDHIEFYFANGMIMRLNDPRRFGCCLWISENPLQHALLADLGMEPLSRSFDAHFLYQHTRQRKQSIKSLIMQQNIIVGVGNIYATEALFLAQIHPLRQAEALSFSECDALAKIIKKILRRAIKLGGTTLRDFINPQGNPGYFQQTLWVYGREGLPCKICDTLLQKVVIAQRSTVFCPACQL